MSWNTVSLGTLCDVKTGKKDVNEGNVNGLYPFFTCAAKHTYSDVFSFDCEAILIAGNGAVGQTSYYKGKFEAYQRTYVLCNFVNVLPQYLLYFLNGSLMNELSSKVLGNTIPYIKKGMLTDFQVPLPSLTLQKKIVAKLDAIFAEIDKAMAAAEANAKNSEALFQSYLTQLFERGGEGWKTFSFGEVLVKTENINPEKEPTRVFQYVDVSSVSKDLLKITEPQIILGKDAPSRARKLIKKDDVLFATVRPTLRRIALVPEELDGEVCSTGYFVLRSNGEILQKFIFYSLLRSEFMDVMEKIQTGASYPAVNDKQVLEQIISFPPLDVQRLNVTKLDSISEEVKKSLKSYTEKANELNKLKQSILRQAFAVEFVKE